MTRKGRRVENHGISLRWKKQNRTRQKKKYTYGKSKGGRNKKPPSCFHGGLVSCMTVTTELRFNGSRSERLPFPVFPTQPFNKSRMSSSRRAPAYSCSSSCSSSPTDSPFGDAARRAAGLTAMGDRRQSFSERRRLTRQRKLRHATDDELGLSLSRSTPVSPESTPKSRSPPGGVNRRWSTAVPQPLPLPELVSGRAAGPSNFRSPPAEGPTSELVGHHISNG
ncbi:hypothetical protein CRG98_034115 [Punica granatum]|uniref:Uncharacterized protein n=1 Tax=Punica granatum TaxID=22663 RepID=A0A2I0IP40_PUNGR|nr:hypothetical protein CRG98_034115 [Punica granatum]